MKLAQSLAMYGLVDDAQPRTDDAHMLDYQHWTEINADSPECIVRIHALVNALMYQWLGEYLELKPSIVPHNGVQIGPNNTGVGLSFPTYGHAWDYAWGETGSIMRYYSWRCGWVEASCRRFVHDLRSDLPVRLQCRVPQLLAGWAP